ncbi:hypothetical protein PR048_032346 [Dryococelus australis]|uniref:Uncharacterized protein n=1 Tax=Dryococelus australis TaxID=614101 RepID=A0ABQ9G561_9NEOP|nr:hypothetical protein PR048_032346 [Dryococelus australis]
MPCQNPASRILLHLMHTRLKCRKLHQRDSALDSCVLTAPACMYFNRRSEGHTPTPRKPRSPPPLPNPYQGARVTNQDPRPKVAAERGGPLSKPVLPTEAAYHVDVSGDIWAALNVEVLRADVGDWSSAGMKGQGKRDIPEKTRRPTASSDAIPTCENPGVTSRRESNPIPFGGICTFCAFTNSCADLPWRRPLVREALGSNPGAGGGNRRSPRTYNKSCVEGEQYNHYTTATLGEGRSTTRKNPRRLTIRRPRYYVDPLMLNLRPVKTVHDKDHSDGCWKRRGLPGERGAGDGDQLPPDEGFMIRGAGPRLSKCRTASFAACQRRARNLVNVRGKL